MEVIAVNKEDLGWTNKLWHCKEIPILLVNHLDVFLLLGRRRQGRGLKICLIKHSAIISPWASPVVLVPMKDGRITSKDASHKDET